MFNFQNNQSQKGSLNLRTQICEKVYYSLKEKHPYTKEFQNCLVNKMPIPQLQSNYLPNGVHDCTLDELKKSFFCNNHRRKTLIGNLEKYVSILKKNGISGLMILDGSFVTAEENPSKIEIVLAITENNNYALASPATQLDHTLFEESYVEKNFELRLFVCFTDAESANGFDDAANCMIEVFKKVYGDVKKKKGLLKVYV